MDFLKSQYERIQQQLSGLSVSQKMLTASLVAIMVMTLAWWGRFAGQAEMEPVLNQTLTTEEIAPITANLAAQRIDYRVVDGKVLVPADQKMGAFAALSYAQLLPQDTKVAFDDIVSKSSMWSPNSERDAMYNHAKEMTLAQIIRRFPDVSESFVLINDKLERHIGGNVEPSASVSITMRRGTKAPRKLVDAVADLIAGAVSGLPRNRVNVVIDSVPFRPSDRGGPDASGQAETIALEEQRLAKKVSDQFAYIPGLMVSVTVKLNHLRKQTDTLDYKKDGVIQKDKRTESHSFETSVPAPPSGEPGVVPNAPGAVANGNSGDMTNSTETTEKNEFEILPSTTRENIVDDGGNTIALAASVAVPRSYLAGVLKDRDAARKDPSPREVDDFAKTELPLMAKAVRNCVGLASDNDVSIQSYTDSVPMLAAAAPATASGSVSMAVGGHAKEIALGALAVVSLFMVLMMVKKGSPAPVVAMASVAMPTPVLEGGEALAGEVGSGSSLLDDMELDDNAIRTQQMLDQVSTMVNDNPDAAANLVKHWLNRT